MSLPYHPTIRPAPGGYVVAATNAAGTELLWGPYPERADAEAVAKRLTIALIDDRASELRRMHRRPRPTLAPQPDLFEAEPISAAADPQRLPGGGAAASRSGNDSARHLERGREASHS